MDRAALSPHSFERHLRAENRSEHTIASYLESVRQAEAYSTTTCGSGLGTRTPAYLGCGWAARVD
jgi:hypothetical protein